MIVKRNGQLDSSFYKAIKREQQRRYVGMLAKAAVKASFKASWYFMATLQDASEHTTKAMDEYREYYGIGINARTEQMVIASKLRNQYGQFASR